MVVVVVVVVLVLDEEHSSTKLPHLCSAMMYISLHACNY